MPHLVMVMVMVIMVNVNVYSTVVTKCLTRWEC